MRRREFLRAAAATAGAVLVGSLPDPFEGDEIEGIIIDEGPPPLYVTEINQAEGSITIGTLDDMLKRIYAKPLNDYMKLEAEMVELLEG